LNILKKVLLFIGVLSLLYVLYVGMYLLTQKYSFSLGNNIAKSINKKSILSLEIGMPKSIMLQKLGEPLMIKKYSKKEYPNYGGFNDFIYAEKGFFEGGIEIDLIIQNDKLKDISLDNYDVSFYHCNKKDCPKIIDEKIFNHWIPK